MYLELDKCLKIPPVIKVSYKFLDWPLLNNVETFQESQTY